MARPGATQSSALDRRRHQYTPSNQGHKAPLERSGSNSQPEGVDRDRQSSTLDASFERCSLHGLPRCPVCSTTTKKEHIEKILANHGRRRIPAPSLSKRLPGSGLRTNCFNAYPCPGGHDVDFAVDYMIEYYAPLIFGSYPKFGNPLVTISFPFAFKNPELFSAMITLAQAHVDTSRADGKPSLESLTFWGDAVTRLKEKMNDPETCADDAAILTNIYLMGAASRFQWQEAVNTFYLGNKRMVAMRGGLDKLGLDGYVKNCILYQDALGLQSVSDDSDQLVFEGVTPNFSNGTVSQVSTPKSSALSPLKYPQHPFSPGTCESLARLPPGLVDLAMHGYMCTDMISIAERLYHFAWQKRLILLEDGPSEPMRELDRLSSRLSTPSEASPKRRIEQIICLGLVILCLEVFTTMTHCLVNQARWKMIKKLLLNQEASDSNPPTQAKLELELKAWFSILAAESGSEQGNFSPDGERIEDMLYDFILDPPSSSKIFTKPNFTFARRWRGKHGLRSVLARFYIKDNLEADWHATWKKQMQRKNLKIAEQDLEGPKMESDGHSYEEEEAERKKLIEYIKMRSWQVISGESPDTVSPGSSNGTSTMNGSSVERSTPQRDNSRGLRVDLSLEDE